MGISLLERAGRRRETVFPPRGPSLRSRTGRGLWTFSVFIGALFLTLLHFGLTQPWYLADLPELARFEAAEPFQRRVLFPTIVALLSWAVPIGPRLLFAAIEILQWMTLLVIAHRALIVFEVGRSGHLRQALAFTIVIPMSLHLSIPQLRFIAPYVDGGAIELGKWFAYTYPTFYYAYDLPAAIFTLGLFLLAHEVVRTGGRQWLAAYVALFGVATANRETTVFMIPLFVGLAMRSAGGARRVLLEGVAWQCALFVTIQGVLLWRFAGNDNPYATVPGTGYEIHLLKNLSYLANPLDGLLFLARLGAGLWIPVLLLRRHLDPLVARALLWFGIPLGASGLLFGRIEEYRILIEIIPLLWLGGLQAIAAAPASARLASPVPLKVRQAAERREQTSRTGIVG